MRKARRYYDAYNDRENPFADLQEELPETITDSLKSRALTIARGSKLHDPYQQAGHPELPQTDSGYWYPARCWLRSKNAGSVFNQAWHVPPKDASQGYWYSTPHGLKSAVAPEASVWAVLARYMRHLPEIDLLLESQVRLWSDPSEWCERREVLAEVFEKKEMPCVLCP